MKKILFLGVVLLGVFLIYLSNLDKKVFYLALGDELAMGYNKLSTRDYGYNDYVKEYLSNKEKLEIYIDSYLRENLRTTDLIRMINDNEKVVIDGKNKSIKNSLIKADLVTISIGNNDILSKLSLHQNYSSKEIYDYLNDYLVDLEKLIKLIREYCKEDIIFIGYYNMLDDTNADKYFKYLNKNAFNLTQKYNVTYIDIFNVMKEDSNKSDVLYPTKKGYIKIGELIKEVIDKKVLL